MPKCRTTHGSQEKSHTRKQPRATRDKFLITCLRTEKCTWQRRKTEEEFSLVVQIGSQLPAITQVQSLPQGGKRKGKKMKERKKEGRWCSDVYRKVEPCLKTGPGQFLRKAVLTSEKQKEDLRGTGAA